MSDHHWHKSWNKPDDEPHERLRGSRSDIHEEGDRGDPPEQHFRNDYGDRGRDHDDTPDAPLQPHDGGNLGWDSAAWDDAGGFEAVLFGHLSNNLGSAGGFPPIIVFAIEDLDVEFNTLIQTTQIQNTLVLLNAANGGSIDVGGDVNALGFQSASTEQSAGIMNLPEFT